MMFSTGPSDSISTLEPLNAAHAPEMFRVLSDPAGAVMVRGPQP